MANLALQGQVKAEINHVPVITINRISIDENLPGQVKKGGYGTIGITDGLPDGGGSFTLSVPATGIEIDLEALKQVGVRFSLSWADGPTRKMASGCKITGVGRSNDPGAGNYDLNVKFIFGELISR